MGIAEILGGIDLLFSLILRFYNVASNLAGTTPIPTLDEIYKKNVDLQAKIDADK
jgi:hypothetical protein